MTGKFEELLRANPAPSLRLLTFGVPQYFVWPILSQASFQFSCLARCPTLADVGLSNGSSKSDAVSVNSGTDSMGVAQN